jgi:predicted Rossmann fold flavoprotein
VANKKVAVIGGGAAGFFAAINSKSNYPDYEVSIFEKSNKLLAKVKISGGGRCNVANATFGVSELSKNYPRGGKQLKKAFNYFATKQTIEWFEGKGVELKTEADNRMFPTTDDSSTIMDSLINTARGLGVQILKHAGVASISPLTEGFDIELSEKKAFFDFVIVASGGSPNMRGFDWLRDMGHEIIPPVPSLFTFNMPDENVTELSGVSVPNAQVKVQGTKLKHSGPLLITHWGMSGPAVLKTSAWGARDLHIRNYNFDIQVNWLGEVTEELFRTSLSETVAANHKRQVKNQNPFNLPNRLWDYFLRKVNVQPDKIWAEVTKKELNRLVNTLLNDMYQVSGKTTFKEEFVTAGGVALSDVDFNTMQSRRCPGLYFAGEVLDIDGVTGGFNFQAAWTTGFIAGELKN